MKLARRIKNRLLRFKKRKNTSKTVAEEYTGPDRVFSIFDKTEQIEENKQVPVRKISNFSWNGSILTIAGYMYIKDLPLMKEDQVRKRLLLVSGGKLFKTVSLRDTLVNQVDVSIHPVLFEKYKWAGFHQHINFSKLMNDKPLPAGEYKLFLEIEVVDDNNIKHQEVHTVGNVSNFLLNDVYATKMDFHSAKKLMKFNLIVTYDEDEKTINLSSNKLQEIDPSLLELDTGKEANRYLKKINSFFFRWVYRLCCFSPIQEKKIVFASDSRVDMSGNFEFVYDELLKREEDFDFKFFLKSSIRDRKSFLELISMGYHFATAKYIFIDDFYPIVYPLKIRKNAELIQLWHAVGAFKTFGYSRIGLPGGPSPHSKNHRNYTKVVVSSENIRKHYAEGFGINIENVISTGVPRTDFFFDDAKKAFVKERLYQEFPFLKEKKVILFAPTFRGNGQQSAHYPFEVLNFERLYQELKDDYIFLFKIHPFVKNDANIPYQYSDFFYDFSSFREINELLLVTDILVTDYSSVCFEYALLNKPMIFFSYDVDDYIRKRDFYYDYFSFIPGPLAKTSEQMISIIKNEQYDFKQIDSFVNYFFDDLDGKSSERVVDQIIYQKDEDELDDNVNMIYKKGI